MSFSAKAFLKTYGTVGVSVYGGMTTASIGSFYLLLRSGRADALITTPLAAVLGEQSEMVQTIKQQLGEAAAQRQQSHPGSTATATATATAEPSHGGASPTPTPALRTEQTLSSSSIHWAREGTYLGVASIIDSLILPIKLAACLPIAKHIILKRRGR